MSKTITKDKEAILDLVALRVEQHGRDLYLFSLTAAQVHDLIQSGKMDIDRWHPDHPEGYQRIPTDSRYKRFGKFVVTNQGVSPVSILVSLRNKDALKIEKLDSTGNTVRLRISGDKVKLYIPDGQHRAYGLRWAVDQYPGQTEDYEIPVILFVADGEDPRFEEANQFYTINQNAKRVRTDLAQRYILRKREKELGSIDEHVALPVDATHKELEPYAVKIADLLNLDGPFKGKIEPPNLSISEASISQTSFVDSIRPILSRASELHWDIGKVVAVLNAFWNAVRSKCPEAFEHWSDDDCDDEDEDHFNAVLVTTAGVNSLNDLLTRSLLLPEISKAPTAPETFRQILDKPALEQYFTDGSEGYWSSDAPAPGAASHGTSRKSFKEISDEIWEAVLED